jgi:effector-binding domain-containing protein
MPNYDVVLKTVPAMLIASRKITIPTNDQVPAYFGPAFDEASKLVEQTGAKWTGACLAVWHQRPDVFENEVVEAAIPIDKAVPGTDRVQVYELPEAHVASVVHHGSLDNFLQAHTALLKWVEDNGYQISGPYREIYINHDHSNMQEAATEVQYPVEKG